MLNEFDKLDKVILWRAEFRTDAYVDQCGLPHNGYVVLEEVEAKIIVRRTVPGDYSDKVKPHQIGYQARSTDKKDGRAFECNWERWPDTCTSNPYWLWYELDANRTEIVEQWYNAEAVAGQRGYPYVRDNVLAIPPSSIVPYCETHMMCYNKDDGFGCYRCDIERRRQEKNKGEGDL